jgi:hypothetical protein
MAVSVSVQVEGKALRTRLFDATGEAAAWVLAVYERAERMGREVVFHHEVTGSRFTEADLEGGWAYDRYGKAPKTAKEAEKAEAEEVEA